MFLYFGTRNYGKVDEVPGVCHVETKFVHFNFVPLIPLGSHAVLRNGEVETDRVSIGLSLKSILVAWLRAVLFFVAAILAVAAFGAVLEGRPDMLRTAGTISLWLVCVLLAYCQSIRWTRASPSRAHQLFQVLGLPTDESIPAGQSDTCDGTNGYASES